MNARPVALFLSIIFSVPIIQCVSAEPAKVTGVFYLKIRNAPDFEAVETGVLAAGDVVDVIGEVGLWANVALEDGTTGYVSRKYLSPVTAAALSDGQPEENLEEPEDPRERETIRAAPVEPIEPPPVPDTAGSPENPPPPPETPPVTRNVQARQYGPALCTSADIQRLRRELRQLAAAQSRLAGLMAAGPREEPAGGDWSSSISTRQMLFWLGTGCVIGWLTAVGLRYRRERRQRGRIRI